MPGSVPTSSLIGSGRSCRRRHAFGERHRGGADEAAAAEDIERTCALADQVRRRLEPRAPVDAAARQQRDVLGAEEPAGRVGRVARVGVLWQEAHERAIELLVQGREEQREHGLRDPRPGRQCGDVLLQALVRAERGDEGMKGRPVQDRRRNRRFRGGHRSRGR